MSDKANTNSSQSIGDVWQRLIGRAVETPEGFRGTIVARTGDWDEPEGRGWFIVAIPGRGQRVYHIVELALLKDDSDR